VESLLTRDYLPRYHADNEAASLTDLKNAFKILARVIAKLNKHK
jgi:acetylornithine deacetylase/succinyl-diaminopimelate desuccinylase-like protein